MQNLIPTIHITNNPIHLTQNEIQLIKQAKYFVYTYGVGLILLSNCTWDCSNSAAAKDYLHQLGIKEVK